jgi:dienelactone hydrolase
MPTLTSTIIANKGNLMRLLISSLITAALATGCAGSVDPTTETPYPTYTPDPTQTPYPTYIPLPTQTPYPTYTPQPKTNTNVVITPTATAHIEIIEPTPIYIPVKKTRHDAIEKIAYTIRSPGGPPPGYGEPQLEVSFNGDLYLPEDLTNTVPAVIFLHGTVGVDSRYEFHRETMLNAGIATFELDLKTGIYDDYYSAPDAGRLQSAVYAALEVLQSLPDINPEKVAVMGFSFGGELAMFVSSQVVEDRYLKPGQPGFAGHVVFYPGCWWLFDPEKDKVSPKICDPVSRDCTYEGKPTGNPIYILAGELDSIREGELCGDLSDVLNNHSAGVAKSTLYPDAYHAFDLRDADITWTEDVWIGPYGHPYESTVRWNEKAANQSTKDALDFLKSLDF